MKKVFFKTNVSDLIRLYELVLQKCASLKALSELEYITPAEYGHISFDLAMWTDTLSILKKQIQKINNNYCLKEVDGVLQEVEFPNSSEI